MNARAVSVVYRKELLDLLRDRRTILSMIIIPVLVMPLLMVVMGTVGFKIVTKARQEIPRIMVLGGDDSPKTVAALHQLKTIECVPPSADYPELISDKKIRAAVEIPPGFDASLENGQSSTIKIYIYEGEMKSSFAADAIETYFRGLRKSIVSRRLNERHVPESLLEPFQVKQSNVASQKKVSGNLIGSILPYLVILMCMTGAIYPAIDLTAGEKERGTMETILCSPVTRLQLVLGKFFMVMTASLVTALLSLSSTGFSFIWLKHLVARSAPLPLTVDAASLSAVFVMLLPVAAIFSAVNLAIGSFSRSSKEANSYLQPLLLVIIVPSVGALLPGVELNTRLALVPVLNVSLVCKEIFSGTFHWNYIALIFLSTCLYASLALATAVTLFKRESVLFRT